MAEAVSTALRFGPYSMPPGYAVGSRIHCERRKNETVVRSITDAPIPWFNARKLGHPILILCGDLVRAVKLESVACIMHHWGVRDDTVRTWRRVLGVGRMTPGTLATYRALMPSKITAEIAASARATSRQPSSREKMSVAKRGKPIHVNTRKALLLAAKRPKSQSHREALSKTRRARGLRPPVNPGLWSEPEDKRLGTAPDNEIAVELQRTIDSVRSRRTRLQIPYFRSQAKPKK